jgi:hypothetical protein
MITKKNPKNGKRQAIYYHSQHDYDDKEDCMYLDFNGNNDNNTNDDKDVYDANGAGRK